MNELSNFDKIRELSQDHYQQKITKEDYRMQRKILLDMIDKEINGLGEYEMGEENDGILDKLKSYFKKTEKEEAL